MSKILRHFSLTFLCVLLLLAWHGSATAQTLIVASQVPSTESGIVVPLLYAPPLAPWPVVPVSINGKPPLLFILDTGTNTDLLLDEWAATALNLSFSTALGHVNGRASRLAFVDQITLSGQDDAGTRHKLNFSVAPNTIQVLPLRYMDLGYAPSAYGGSRLAGIMGLPLLEFFVARFDFAAKTLTLFDSHHAPFDTAGTTSALEKFNALYCVPASIQGVAVPPLLFDTGSVFTSLPEGAMTDLMPLAATKKTYRGVDNVVHITDKLLLSDVQLGASALPQAVFVIEPKRRSTSLGMDILKHFRVTLDVPRKLLALEPLSQQKVGLPGQAGLSLRRYNGHYYIAAVAAQSAAGQAGAQAQDRIIKVDGMLLDDAPHIVAQLAIDGAAGSTATLLLQHDNGRQSLVSFKRGGEFPAHLNASVGLGLQILNGGPLMVRSVTPGSVADAAGVLPDDEIIQINALSIDHVSDEQIRENLLKPEIILKLKRDSSPVPLQVKLRAVAM